MQQTYQTRLDLTAPTQRWLSAFGELFGQLERLLYQALAQGEDAIKLKPAFCLAHGLSARQYNALCTSVEGKIAGTVELLKLRKAELTSALKRTGKTIAKLDKQIAGQDKLHTKALASAAKSKKPMAFSLKPRDGMRKQRYNQKLRQQSQQNKLDAVKARLLANVPGLCFGSRKLFNQQFHLESTEFGTGDEGHAAWRRAWLDARSHQFFLKGSKDETGGNQSCKAAMRWTAPTNEVLLAPLPRPWLHLLLKMPPALVARGAPKFVTLEGVRFTYGQAQIEAALRDGVALSYRFHSDNHSATGWRVFVSTDVAEAALISLDSNMGVLGVDFNEHHLAVTKTDRFGNLVRCWRIDLHLKGKSAAQREALLSKALGRVVDLARLHSCPVAIEDLDFAAKKQELRGLGAKYARMLSGLAFAKYKQLLQAKLARAGIELILVNPAYTSVMGSVKYAGRLGLSVHNAAAGVIARRAQGYSEKLPTSDAQGVRTFCAPLMGCAVVLTLPVESSKSTRASWAAIRTSLTRHCAGVVRHRKEASRRGRRKTPEPGSMHDSGEAAAALWEPGELLARRGNQTGFPDVPF